MILSTVLLSAVNQTKTSTFFQGGPCETFPSRTVACRLVGRSLGQLSEHHPVHGQRCRDKERPGGPANLGVRHPSRLRLAGRFQCFRVCPGRLGRRCWWNMLLPLVDVLLHRLRRSRDGRWLVAYCCGWIADDQRLLALRLV